MCIRIFLFMALVASGISVHAEQASTSTGMSQKLRTPAPLDSQACGGSCLEYVAAGRNSFVVARDPHSGAVLKSFPVDLPLGSSFGASTLSRALPAGAEAATLSTAVYGANTQIVGYLVTTYLFSGGGSNVSSAYVPTHPQ